MRSLAEFKATNIGLELGKQGPFFFLMLEEDGNGAVADSEPSRFGLWQFRQR